MRRPSALKMRRQQLGKRQVDVWLESGVWPSRVSFIEGGLIRPKRASEIAALARAYEVSEEEFAELLRKGRRDCAA